MPNLKSSAVESATGREIWYAIGVYDAACRAHAEVAGVVTSLNDSKHGTNSLHYKDRAFDGRSKHLPLGAKIKVFDTLKRILEPQGFDVLLERAGTDNEHFHVEWDKKPGEEFIERVS